MGCAFTKSVTNVKSETTKLKSEGKNSNPLDLPEPPPSDPRLPLTYRQTFQITKSWKGIQRAMQQTGVAMFVKLFEENSELLNLFNKFQGLKTKESQRESMELAEHASRVMTTLDESITSLENVDFFVQYLYSIGRYHKKIPGFKKENFWKIEKPFLTAVKDTLDDRFTENMENIYKIAVQLILETLITGFDTGTTESDLANGRTGLVIKPAEKLT